MKTDKIKIRQITDCNLIKIDDAINSPLGQPKQWHNQHDRNGKLGK